MKDSRFSVPLKVITGLNLVMSPSAGTSASGSSMGACGSGVGVGS